MKTLVAIVGPTAVGKSEVALKVAERINGAVISCDSMQVYRGMDIGTAKPSLEDRQRIPHFLIDVVEPDQDFTVVQYQKLALKAITEVQGQGMVPMLVGGTGLYYQAVVDGYNFAQHEDARAIRKILEERVAREGLPELYRELSAVDRKSATAISPMDERRIIRALEVYYVTGKPISEQAKRSDGMFNLAAYGLTRQRQELYHRIEERVDQMIEGGLLKEVRRLVESGIGLHHTAMQGIGYKEMCWYLEGLISFEEAVRIIKRESRRYAKRQLTWFRRDPRIKWFDLSNISLTEVVEIICEGLGRTLADSVE